MIADRAAEEHPGGGRPPPSCQMEQQALWRYVQIEGLHNPPTVHTSAAIWACGPCGPGGPHGYLGGAGKWSTYGPHGPHTTF